MRIIKSIMTGATLALACCSTFAQGNFDYFAAPKTIVLQPPTALAESSTNVLLTTNVVPVSKFLGIVAIDIFSISNSVGAAGVVAYNPTNSWQLYSSVTGTNGWSPITNGLFAIPASQIYSNYFGTSNNAVVYFTNTYMVPGTLTYASVGSQFYSGQYVVPSVPTASSTTASSAISTNWTVGFDIDNAGNYIAIVWSTSGSNAVYSVGATLRGRTKAGQY